MEDIKEVALLPCPFCGGEVTEDRIEPHSHAVQVGGLKMPDYPGAWTIECYACGVGIIDHEAREKAVERWNRRAELQKDAEPVGRVVYGSVFHEIGSWGGLPPGTPLYTHPQPKAATVPQGLVELLRQIRPEYGAVGSRDVDVRRQQEQIDAAIAMLEAAPSLPAAEDARDGWISVEDRLPEEETPVLILLRGEVVIGERRWDRPSFEDTYRAFWYWDDPRDDGQDWENDEVTHWRPLPAAPAMSQDSKGEGK